MGFYIVTRDPNSYIDTEFYSQEEAYHFALVTHLSDKCEWDIVTSEYLQEYLMEEQQQENGGYQQNIEILIDERPKKRFVSRYYPNFYKPTFGTLPSCKKFSEVRK